MILEYFIHVRPYKLSVAGLSSSPFTFKQLHAPRIHSSPLKSITMTDAIKIDADLAAYLNVVPKTYSLSVLAALVGYLIYKVNLVVA